MTDLQQVRKVSPEMLDAIEASGLDADGVFKMKDGKKKLSVGAAKDALGFAERLKMTGAAGKLRSFIAGKAPTKQARPMTGSSPTLLVALNSQTGSRVAFADLMPLFPEGRSLPLGKVLVSYEGEGKAKDGKCVRVVITRAPDPTPEEKAAYEKKVAPRKKAAAEKKKASPSS